jgi:hypothetical protein
VIHNLTANIGQFISIVTALFSSLFERRMFSRGIVMNITSARGTLRCRKTHIPCGDKLVIFGHYVYLSWVQVAYSFQHTNLKHLQSVFLYYGQRSGFIS